MTHNIRFSLFIVANNLDFDYVAKLIPINWICRKRTKYIKSVIDAGLATDSMEFQCAKTYGCSATFAFCPIKEFIGKYGEQLNQIRRMFGCNINIVEYLHTEQGDCSVYALSADDLKSLQSIEAELNIDRYWYEKEESVTNADASQSPDGYFLGEEPEPEMNFTLSFSNTEVDIDEVKTALTEVFPSSCNCIGDRVVVNVGKIQECSTSDALGIIKNCLVKLISKFKNECDFDIIVSVEGRFSDFVVFELTADDIAFLCSLGASFGVTFV